MEWFIKAFIRASLLWFVSGIILGVAMAVQPAWIVYRAPGVQPGESDAGHRPLTRDTRH